MRNMVGMTYAQEQTSEVHAQTLSLPLICLWNRLIFVTYNITIHKHTDNTISMEINWTMFHDAVNADFFSRTRRRAAHHYIKKNKKV